MGKINLLDQNTINQIAAGEVIDRPSSVVKELMENSIDAGANIIAVEIKDGGLSSIRITDNGSGIARDDIKTAFLRHSTSKIKSVEDLACVSSLGFRGEALSSIAAVCQVELITKTKDTLLGSRYVIEGGNEMRFEELGVPDGTTFYIRNIFFNTPARRKFMKSSQTEAGYISDVVSRIALSHPEVSIKFTSNNQLKIYTPGNGNLKDVIYNIYGREISANLIEIDNGNEFMHICGYLGKPIINKGNRTFENYFINGRYIKSAIVAKAIEEAYKPYMMQHKYPFTALHFSIDSDLLDVNVHPAKMELRFRNADKIYPFIVDTLTEALKEKPLIPDVSLDNDREIKEKERELSKEKKEIKIPEPFEVQRIKEDKIHVKETNIAVKKETVSNTDIKESEIKESDIKEAGIKKTAYEFKYNTERNDALVISETKIRDTKQETLFSENFLSEKARLKHKIIGQVFDTYWIVEYDNKMFIIDQHAAHEKVMYEMLMERLRNKQPATQLLNPPIILTLSMSEENLVNKYLDSFAEIGFEIEPFGGKEYAVRGVPLDLYALSDKDMLMDIIDGLEDESGKLTSEILTDKIASMSCKAAVKGNNRLSYSEANELIDKLLKLDNPYNCPHGRPTIISMTKYELEKKFKRII